ncbi:MFS family permease [Sphingobium sp. B2D3A]|uniref:spinster family MFS transporter n=1 Tax=unclassified Sphingobium TaxID=2611147 RepID=UPI0022252706|nr:MULTISPECIES: MFS transporter [unclassified Sphingobium]MCW2337249.1 MFS family permease [Sphingobium sp. B2D3A]MCW2383707.1 MFS family permease [Sphingobium sp. B2D3D]
MAETTAPPTGPGSGPEGGVKDWNFSAVYGLGFLTLVSAFNYLDRSLLGLALPSIKSEMHVSDTALGLVSGLAFLLFYSILGVPIAWAADRYNRRNIIAVGFAFWSLMTMVTGWVANIWQLAIARFLMGAGEACGIAPSNSIISDLFRAERRPLAFSIFGTAVSISSILFFPIVGWVGHEYGWRAMFVVAGMPGVFLALLFFLTVKEPERGASEAKRIERAARESFKASMAFLAKQRAYVFLVIGATLMGLNVFAASVWTPTFLTRVHGLTLVEVAATIGPIRGVFGVAGVVLGGLLIDRLSRKASHWRMTLPAISCLLAAPAELIFLLAEDTAVWLAAYAASAFLLLIHQGPVFAAVMSVAKLRMRAVATSILLFSAALIGQALGPLVVGYLNDVLHPTLGDVAVRYSMLVIVVTALLAGVMFLLAGRSLEADAKRALADA